MDAKAANARDKMNLLKPNMSEEMAKDLVQLMYGLEITSIKRMSSFNDQNFHIQVSQQHHNPFISDVASDGYTLKIINTVKSALDGHFDSIHLAMRRLDNKGLCVPQVIMNLKGSTWTLEDVPVLKGDRSSSSVGKCGIYLLTYLPGETLPTGTNTVDILFQWGLLLAKFHNALQDLSCPALRNKIILVNLEHILGIEDLTDSFEENKKKLVYSVLERYRVEILKHMNDLPKGFIHGDANGYNILKQVQGNDQVPTIVGLLDFEDIHYGTYLWDLGIVLAHSMMDINCMDPIAQIGHTLAGYLSLRSLNELEMSLLKMCIECRLCQSAVLCDFGAQNDPSNTYISKLAGNMRWNMLELLCEKKTEDVMQNWKEIRQGYQNN